MRRAWGVVGPPFVLLLVWSAFSGWTFVADLALDEGVNPLALTLERQLVAVPVMLWFAHWNKGDLLPWASDVPLVLLLGALGFGNIVGAIEALKYINAGVVALGQLCIPVVTGVFCWLFGAERGSGLKAGGVVVAVVGAIMISVFYRADRGNTSHSTATGLWWVGLMLLVMQVVCASGLAVALGSMVRRYRPASVTAWYHTVGTLLTLFACIISRTSLRDFGLRGRLEPWIALVYGALVVSFFNWNAISWALSKLPPTIVMATGTLRPPVTALLALGLRQEALGPVEWIGCVMVAAGLVILWVAHRHEEEEGEEEQQQYLQGERMPLLEDVTDI